MENRTIELVKVHNSNTCISIRDTGINDLEYDLLYLEIGMLKRDKKVLILDSNSLITAKAFLEGKIFDINSYTMGVTQLNEELLNLEIGVIEINYYQFEKLGTFEILDNVIIINQNILNALDFNSKVCINGEIYTINRNKTYDNRIVLNEILNFNGVFDVYVGCCDTKYIINDYLIKHEFVNVLRDNILNIDNLKCNSNNISKEKLVTLLLEIKALSMLKDTCDIIKIASLIDTIKNKLNIQNGKCSC